VNFTIKGERRTGTTYLADLITENFNGKYIDLQTRTSPYWKHDAVPGEKEYYNREGVHVISISKNIFSWLLSLKRTPWHMGYTRKLKFRTFITSEVKNVATNWNLASMYGVQKGKVFARYKNPVEMYNIKYRKIMRITDLHVKYEDLLLAPQRVFDEMNKSLILSKRFTEFEDVGSFSEERRNYYLNEEYMDCYDQSLIELINNELDHQTYHKMGYE